MHTESGSNRKHKASAIGDSFGQRANLFLRKCRDVEQGKNLKRYGFKNFLAPGETNTGINLVNQKASQSMQSRTC